MTTIGAPPHSVPRTRGTERIFSLDVLRGLAILGTLGTNIWIFAGTGADLQTERIGHGLGAAVDRWISEISDLITNGRALSLLSILFGVGMAILFESAQRRGHRWPLRYWWRSLLLVADGVIHYLLVFQFDILMGYGLTALVVAPLMFLRGWRLWVAGIAFGALHLWRECQRNLEMFQLARTDPQPPAPTDIDLSAHHEPFTYLGQVSERFAGFWDGRYEALYIAPPLNAVLFLVGVGLWRAGLFTRPEATRRLRIGLAVSGLGLGGGVALLPLTGLLDDSGKVMVYSFSRYTIAPVIALGYLGLTLIVLQRCKPGFMSRRFADVGRMALSCYVLQNIIGSVAFYHWGLRLGPLTPRGTLVAFALISAILMLFANLWFRRFPMGPFETAWRWMSDLPFTRRPRRPRLEPAPAQGLPG